MGHYLALAYQGVGSTVSCEHNRGRVRSARRRHENPTSGIRAQRGQGCSMIIKTRQPKPKMLKRVTFRCTGTCLWHDSLRKKTAEHKRFTARRGYKPDPKRPGW